MRNAIKVLIVDDDKASGLMLSEVVKRLGFKPIVTNKPSDALNVVRLQTVHAALVDVLLPKMRGVELVAEFRKTKFAENPVIFVSGVFKDKNFAAETIKKTGASDFLFKPFTVEEMTASLTKALQGFLSAEKWSVQSLLTRKLNSDRERAKAIENLEQMKGLDFPFVLSILMEVGSSGHLNIVNELGEIFGVSLIKGTIAEVDATESQSSTVLSLISQGFLSQDDWDTFQSSGAKKFSLERLVEEGYVSPHAVSNSRHQQIMADFRAICAAELLQVNFVPKEDNEESPKHAVKLHDLMSLLESSLDEFFPEKYLEEFYAPVKESPIRIVRSEQDVQSVWATNAFKNLAELKDSVENGGTLELALQNNPEVHSKTYQCLHYLVLNRAIMFDDLNRAKNLNTMLERYKKLYGELQNRTPDKIFEYFGASQNSSGSVIQTIFDEYSKSNNPDQMAKDATPELKEYCRKCFELVNQAREVLTDETKRVALFAQLKASAAEKQVRSQKMMNEGLEMLRKGQAKEAFATLSEASALFETSRLMFIRTWAEIKSGAELNKPQLHERLKKLENTTSADDKKSSFYYMATGLVKKALGDATAPAMFERALQIDSQFAEARRELHSMQAATAPPNRYKDKGLFTGDITEIVSQIFRRKID